MKNWLATLLTAFALVGLASLSAQADGHTSLKGEGWIVHETAIPYAELYPRFKTALKTTKLRQITTASASAGAKGRGITIPGNRVVGVYNNFFAVRMLEASIAAGMEAPLRFYLTETSDGGSALSYKIPTLVFSPYFEEGGEPLKTMAGELDVMFKKIAEETIK